ncbi:MAG: hypothetical protein ABIJ39_13110 [Chloroflexota bacterium]
MECQETTAHSWGVNTWPGQASVDPAAREQRGKDLRNKLVQRG